MIRASTAIPFIFSPVRLGTQLLVDGGLTQNVPVSAAEEFAESESDVFVTVSFLHDEDESESKDWLHQYAYAVVQAARSTQPTAVSSIYKEVPIQLSVSLDPLDFKVSRNDRQRAIDEAFENAKSTLESNLLILS